MPRVNKNRTVDAEERLAARIAVERKLRGWTYAQLAEAMTALGCDIHVSALHKLEHGGRRITVNEAAALSTLWQIPIDRLIEERRS